MVSPTTFTRLPSPSRSQACFGIGLHEFTERVAKIPVHRHPDAHQPGDLRRAAVHVRQHTAADDKPGPQHAKRRQLSLSTSHTFLPFYCDME